MSDYLGMPAMVVTNECRPQFDFSELGENGVDRIGELNAYITLACDLRCGYCYMGDFLQNARDKTELMPSGFLTGMIDTLVDEGDGLDRATLLGGEPTIHPEITEIANAAAERKISQLRMTTNGVGLHSLDLARLRKGAFECVSVSLDGVTAEENNATRGRGTFDRVVRTLTQYKGADVPLNFNYTVTKHNVNNLLRVPEFFRSLGATSIDFHRASMDGTAYDNPELVIGASQWVDARDELLQHVSDNARDYKGMTFRIPYIFLTEQQMVERGYKPIHENSYHSPEGGHRLIVLPPTPKGQGLCYISSDLIGRPGTELGRISPSGKFHWNKDPRNEMTVYRAARAAGSLPPNVSTLITEQDIDGEPYGLKRVSHSFKAIVEY